MRKHISSILIYCLLFSIKLAGQQLKPGFYKSECLTMLEIGANFDDSLYASKFPEPVGYKMIYRSKV
ncbi:MAG TPA: hypothetical protein VGI38_08160, partial [Puia sp.]